MSRFSDVVGDTYKVIKGYIAPRKAKALAKDFIQYTRDNQALTEFHSDETCNVANDQYNYPSHLNILSKKTAEVGKMVGADVNPAYAYSRVYGKGGILQRHKDRDSCEVSLSIHLNGDQPWAFGIKNLAGEEVELMLEPGDAVLYDAPHATHWRPGEYEGEAYCQIFQHYVFVDGDYADYAFDTPKLENKRMRVEGKNHLAQYIYQWDDILDEETLRLAHEVADRDQETWVRAQTSGGNIEYRKCYVYDLMQDNELDEKLDNKLFEATGEVFRRINATHDYLSLTKDDGYKILRYPGGDFKGKYDMHTDHSEENNRMFTIIYILNDDYEGGELAFFDGAIVIKPKAGTIVAFPSSYMFPHAVLPCTSGERRSIITWAT